MKTTNILALGAASFLFLSATASAQLAITTVGQTSTINFQSDFGWDGPTSDPTAGDDVFKWKTGPSGGGNFRGANERDSWSWGGANDFGMSAEAWSWRAVGVDLGMGSGVRSQFGDYNNDGDLADTLNVITALTYTDLATFGISADANDFAYGIGRNGGNNAPYRSFDLTLRVKNTSGAGINDWNMSLNTWYADTDSANANASISYSTDNVNFTLIDGYTTTNTSNVYTKRDLAGSFNASVANGEYLYLQFANYRVGEAGSGAGIVIDNWTVGSTPVPEPGTYAAIASIFALGVAFLRRRRA